MPPGCSEDQPVFPYRLAVALPSSLDRAEGAILVGAPDRKGVVYGLRGEYASPEVNGYYSLAGGGERPSAVIRIFDGALYLDGQVVEQAAVRARNLVWSDLPEAVCEATGLPPSGTLEFNPPGVDGVGPGRSVPPGA